MAVFLAAYNLLFFTKWCYESSLQLQMGNVLLSIIGSIVTFNMVFIVIIIVRAIIQKCRTRCAKKQHAIRMKEIQKSKALRLEREAAAKLEVFNEAKLEKPDIALQNQFVRLDQYPSVSLKNMSSISLNDSI